MKGSVFHLAVNSHQIDGIKKRGKWTFTCPDFPELEREFKGAKELGPVTAAFMAKALAGSFTFGYKAAQGR
jgi:hypothetical protein